MIPLMKSAFLDEYDTKQSLASFILEAPKLSMDKQCLEFELEFARWQGRKYAILCNSGGSANLLLIQALLNLGKLRNQDIVGFSALTWSTNVMPILQLGLKTLPIDCSYKHLNVTADILKSNIHDIHAFFATNVLGFAGDLHNIRQLCCDNKVIYLEDNCEALGSVVEGTKCGNFGLASTFSFFVAHHMSTIEGGMVCTDDKELANALIIARANGWDRNLEAKTRTQLHTVHNIQSEFRAKYTFYDLAFNVRPTEITGFLGRLQLSKVDKANVCRKSIYADLAQEMLLNNDLHVIPLDQQVPFALPVICKTPELRDKYIYEFSGAGVEIRPLIAGNMSLQPFYKKCNNALLQDLPNTDLLDNCGFYCGLYPELTGSDIELLKAILRGRL